MPVDDESREFKRGKAEGKVEGLKEGLVERRLDVIEEQVAGLIDELRGLREDYAEDQKAAIARAGALATTTETARTDLAAETETRRTDLAAETERARTDLVGDRLFRTRQRAFVFAAGWAGLGALACALITHT